MKTAIKFFCKTISLAVLVTLTSCGYEAMPGVDSKIDKKRLKETKDYYEFSAKLPSENCLILYPGALVDEFAYAPYLQNVADAGFTSYLIKPPFNFAFLDSDAADVITTANNSTCENYVVAGHSLGGVVAANYVEDKPDYGLLLLAAYPQKSTSLVEHRGPVISISASLDGLVKSEKLKATAHLLPQSTEWVEIEGGNHAQFGWYGLQKKDGTAVIDRQTQQQIVVDKTVKALQALH